jgi:hypothetical protein
VPTAEEFAQALRELDERGDGHGPVV